MQNKIDSECSANISDDSTISDKVMIALRKIIRSIDMNSKKLVKRVGLTGPQLMILREIAVRNDITPGEIATAVSLSQATVTGILERMEKRELLTRKRSENDKRRSLVRLTELGRQTIENAPPLMQETFVERFTSLQEWEQMLILSALQRLVVLMEAKAIDAAPYLETSSFERDVNPN
ncbi:MarR family transcriptional regulator [uncultured Desulfosarcina sp.]|uniref:MarR family winged helix-turn-helix transcriptional regulator n=1 Tax=uncultured Desulfosarcina sp. TaxID=218289 RepID=UPI0029C8C2EA|nr:MarR family transcriptional regulator [uncultured Desulfosarcina sp.]